MFFSHPCILSREQSDLMSWLLLWVRSGCASFFIRVILGKEGGGRESHVKQLLLAPHSLSQANMRLNLASLGF